jgi:hypothetical protein
VLRGRNGHRSVRSELDFVRRHGSDHLLRRTGDLPQRRSLLLLGIRGARDRGVSGIALRVPGRGLGRALSSRFGLHGHIETALLRLPQLGREGVLGCTVLISGRPRQWVSGGRRKRGAPPLARSSVLSPAKRFRPCSP